MLKAMEVLSSVNCNFHEVTDIINYLWKWQVDWNY